MTWKLKISTEQGGNIFTVETNQRELGNAEQMVRNLYGQDTVIIAQDYTVRDDDWYELEPGTGESLWTG